MAGHATVRNQLALDEIVEDYEQIMLIAVFYFEVINHDWEWIIDSRFSNHIIGDTAKFLSLVKYGDDKLVL